MDSFKTVDLFGMSQVGLGRYGILYNIPKSLNRYRIKNIDIKEFHIVTVSKVSVYRNFGMDNIYIGNFGVPRYKKIHIVMESKTYDTVLYCTKNFGIPKI